MENDHFDSNEYLESLIKPMPDHGAELRAQIAASSGLEPEAGETPAKYAARAMAEGIEAMRQEAVSRVQLGA